MSRVIIDEFGKKHPEFTNLLLIFLLHGYEEDKKDIDAIREYVLDLDTEDIQKGIAQAKEILAIDPFPYRWIADTADNLPFDEGLDPTPENYRAWVEWMVKALEEEARKAGKL